MHLCPGLSPPKPLEQSKNVTIRTYHKLPEDENGPSNWPKRAKNCHNQPKFDFLRLHVTEPCEAGQSRAKCSPIVITIDHE